ncbi:MAG TPA: DUF397 domain-containing protein [Pseudonocardia sp.]|nr:DUF397 domain-containing protein [Pseudonocardia sp.]
MIEFKISSFCSSGGCVEVGHSSAADAVIVRDSKDPMRSVSLRFSSAQWLAFTEGVRRGDFDGE